MANYTPLIIPEKKSSLISVGKELEQPEKKKDDVLVSEASIEQVEKAEASEYIETVPEAPEVPPDIQKMGVQASPPVTGSIFVGNKKIDLPMPLEEIEDGLKKPPSSGKRWLAEFLRYLLKRLHLIIKRVHGKLTVSRG